MAQLNKTPRYTRASFGANGDTGRRNVCHVSFVATDLRAPAAASATVVASVITLTTSGTTSQPLGTITLDVPRNVTVTLAGTTASIGAGNITVTGTNASGAVITELLAVTAATGGLLSGTKAFKTVTQLDYPATSGAGATATVGVGSKLGIGLTNLTSGVVRVWAKTVAGPELNSNETLIAPTSSTLDATVMENNTVVVNGTLNATIEYRVYVLNYNWVVHPLIGSNVNSFGLK